MNKLILCLFFSTLAGQAFSQKLYFVYLQSDSEQPFYVRMSEKVYSSSASGYLILSRLKDSTYPIRVGFPGNKVKEQNFTLIPNKKDRGYLLKDFGEKGWGLFDLQSMSVQMAVGGNASVESTTPVDDKDVTAFTAMLSRAADDPSLKEKPVREKPSEVVAIKEPNPAVVNAVVSSTETREQDKPVTVENKPSEPVVTKQENKPVETKVEEKPVATVVVNAETIKESSTEKPATAAVTENPQVKDVSVSNNPEEYKRSEVVRGHEMTGADGHGIVFIDKQGNGSTDTIRVLIPNPKPLVEPAKEQAKEEKKFLELNTEAAKKDEPAKEEKPEKKEDAKTAVPNVKVEEPAVKDPATDNQATKKEEAASENSAEKTIAVEDQKPAGNKQAVTRSCSDEASESDFLKLRRKMAGGSSDDEMVMEARKYFKSTCFTVYQVRNLGNLFLTDEGKYKFYDAAYMYVSDPHNFISLQMELKDEYYVKRFKAMLR